MSQERDQTGGTSGPRTKRIITPIMLTAVGTGWLLTAHDVIPGVQWAWVLGLAALGGLVLFIEGVNKFSFVVGPALVVASLLSVLRQTGYCSVDTEVPLITITFGGLWTLTHVMPLSLPKWVLTEQHSSAATAPARTSLARS